jgi:hypothetical protein
MWAAAAGAIVLSVGALLWSVDPPTPPGKAASAPTQRIVGSESDTAREAIALDRATSRDAGAPVLSVEDRADGGVRRSAAVGRNAWIDVGPSIDGGDFEITWNVYDNDVTGSFYTRNDNLILYQLADRTARILAGASARFADRGQVELTDPVAPALDQGFASGVWVTHPGAEARFLALSPGERPAHVLVPATPVAPAWIRVLDQGGAPVAGARVRQQALPPNDTPTIITDIRVRARRALVRETLTDAEGRAPRLALGGPSRVDVTDGERSAFAVLNDERRDVEVVLNDTWRVRGRVVGDADPGAWATVVVLVVDGTGRRRSVASTVLEERMWGPLAIPHDSAAASYDVELRYGAVQPELRTIPPPTPGQDIQVDFDGAAGHRGWIHVLDEETEEPVFGALVELRWQSAASSRMFHARSGTGETGWAGFEGLPDAIDGWSVRADGYGTEDGGPLAMAVEQPAYNIRLAKAGRIEGTLDFEGADPTDFVVMHDIEGAAPLRASQWFRSPTSGRFVIEDARPGARVLHARVGRRTSPLTRVVVESGRTTHVALQLLPTNAIRGRVVDATDGTPVADASVAIGLAGGDLREASTLSEGWRTDSNGAFEIHDVPLREATIRVTAERYAAFRSELGLLHARGIVDLGVVPLRPRLTVRATLVGDMSDPALYRAGLQERPETFRSFGGDRHALLVGAVMGENTVLIHPSGHEDLHLRSVATEGTRDVPMHAWPGEVTVEFVDDGGAPVEFGGVLDLTWTDPSGTAILRSHQFSPTSRITTAGLPSSRIGYAARNVGNEMAASGSVPFDGRSGITIRFSQDRVFLRIVDTSGEEVPNVFVLLDVARDGELVSQQMNATAADGTAAFAAPQGGTVFVSAHAPDERRVIGRRIEVPSSGARVDVTLDGNRTFEVTVVSDEHAVANAGYRILYPYGVQLVRYGSTDLSGGIRMERLGPEPLLLEVDIPGHWPVSRLLAPGPEHIVEAPPLVDWELRVVDANGLAVAGAAIDLEHATLRHYHRARGELGGSVRAWMDAGVYSTAALTTDSFGRLRLSGLPKGTYRVRATIDADRWSTGEVQVGGVTAVATLVLP